MTLLADLRSGTYGLRFNPPPSFNLEVDQDTIAAFQDEEHRVDWFLEFSPLIVDLSIRYDEILRKELHIDTVTVFESYFKKSRQQAVASAPAQIDPTGPVGSPLKTACLCRRRDPTWAPVHSLDRIEVCAFVTLFRRPPPIGLD